jgi:hypothetical protein
MANFDSLTGARAVFDRLLRSIPPEQALIFMLGEIDCAFLAWSKAARHGTSVDDELLDSFRRYAGFLRPVADRMRHVMVVAVPPPTGTSQPAVARGRKDVNPTLEERVVATTSYNRMLRSWCTESAVDFIDYEEDALDPSSGLVRQGLVNPERPDHHLAAGPFAEIIAGHLAQTPLFASVHT